MAEGVSIIENTDGTRSYRAFVYDRREGKKIRKTFPTHAAARSWRTEAQAAVRAGRIRAVVAGSALVDAGLDQFGFGGLLAGEDVGGLGEQVVTQVHDQQLG